MITYCVSGDQDIEPTGENLRASGRDVLHGEGVDANAVVAFPAGGTFVVVAHGDEDGNVFLKQRASEPQVRWLWVGMNPQPATTRVYLYCCKAGPNLVGYLTDCHCLGHSDIVPMPVDEDKDEVISFLDEVDVVMQSASFNVATSSARLRQFVATKFDDALRSATEDSYRHVVVWSMLARSLS